MTIGELMKHLHMLQEIHGADIPVYGIDSERDWHPLHADDVRCLHVTKMGRDTARDDDFYITIKDEHDPPNGVGIGI
jgi:hypothetical protein